ncbi:hypothetical protein [Micromonospora sp. NPDC001898]|uniref:hypothetical protein n=1 Tax=Micromonospora sp. NPDC001898 TaxID=3364221 RepID=UPI0036A9D5B2
MTGTTRRWWELEIVVPADRWCAFVADVAGPLLDTCASTGSGIGGALLVRDVTAQGVPAIYVQALAASGSELADAYRTVLRASPEPAVAGAVTVDSRLPGGPAGPPDSPVASLDTAVVRPARLVPLAGPVFGGAALPALTRTFLHRVGPALVQLAQEGRGQRRSMLEAALPVMAAQLKAQGPSAAPGAENLALNGVPLGFLSFRSHAEAFFATCRDPAAARAAMDGRYHGARAGIDRTVAAVFEAAETGSLRDGPAGLWYATACAAKAEFMSAFRAGELTISAPPDPTRHGNDLAHSRFHRKAGASTTLQTYIQGDPAFLAVRLCTSLLYLGLHTAGLTLAERYFLCHVIGRACESLSGADALSILDDLS